MTDYELIMIILTFLTLLVAVDKKNRGSYETTGQMPLPGGQSILAQIG